MLSFLLFFDLDKNILLSKPIADLFAIVFDYAIIIRIYKLLEILNT